MDQRVAETVLSGPGVGESVRFRMRDWYNGRLIFPAIVLDQRDDGSLKLYIVRGADDTIEQDRVKPFNEADGQGWLPIERAVTEKDGDGSLAEFRDQMADVIFGENERDERSIYDILTSLHQRLEKLEGMANTAAPVAAGRQTRRARRG